MYLYQLIYASTVTESFKDSDLKSILVKARGRNSAENITGLLCFDGKYFMQCLEGGRSQINAVYAKILADTSHQEVELLSYGPIAKRNYAQWEMGLVPKEALTAPLNLLYSASGRFEPYAMPPASSEQLLMTLRAAVPLL